MEQWAVDLIRLTPQPAFAAAQEQILAVNEAAAKLGLAAGAPLDQVLDPIPTIDGTEAEFRGRLLGREVCLRCLCRDGVLVCAASADPTEAQPVSPSLLHTAASIRASIQELNVALYGLQDPAVDSALRAVSLAQRSLYQLEHTASHLEQFYRLSIGDYRPCRQPVPVNKLFYSLCGEAESLLRYRDLPLRYRLLASEHIRCVDEELLTLMFWELISNAAGHCDASGLSLTLRRPADDLLVLTVANHPEAADPLPEHLFDRHAASERELSGEKGPGFGLSLVSMAAGLHGGSLVFSTEADGTVRAALSIRMPNNPDEGLHAARWLVQSGLNYGLISLSGCLPVEAFHPSALQG